MENTEAFRQLLSLPVSSEAIRATPISADGRCWIAAGTNHEPIFVVECQAEEIVPPAILLSNFVFTPWSECRIAFQSVERIAHASIVRCTSDDPEIHEFFIRSVSGIVSSPACVGSMSKFAEAIQTLVLVFRALAQPALRSVQGIWAEIWLLSRAKDLSKAISAWHSRPTSLFDFDDGAELLEVKSTSSPLRMHRFKLAQLVPRKGSELLIASLVVRRDDGGQSLHELWDVLNVRVGAEEVQLRAKIALVIAEALGDGIAASTSHRFVIDSSTAPVAVYRADDIPKTGVDADPAISDVQFTVDLSGCPRANLADVGTSGGLYESLLG